ncbi:helix-turn-helix domain-containing protein [Streptococcus merionis]|uniref:helix-turn-helix domain-containing protein n=1 Tax=Streptococcus merionis TaxID=400065 RepID=UPI00351772D0
MFSTFEKIRQLAKKRGVSLQKVAEDLGFSVNYLYTLKEKTPKSDKLQEIADYFNVSTDYLLGRTDNPNIAENTTIDGQVIDLRKAAANTMLFDGKKLDEDDIDFITAVLSAHFKAKEK